MNAIRSTNAVGLWAGVAVLYFAWGCTQAPRPDYGQLGLVEISGTITLDGAALPHAAIFFVNETDETHSYGLSDKDGHYTMMLNSRKSGVIPGTKRIEIATDRNPLGESAGATSQAGAVEEEDPDARRRRGPNEKVPPCYNDRSTLKLEITTSDSSLDFDLASDCSSTFAR